VSDFIGKYCYFTNQYYKEWVACDLCITRCYCVPCNHNRQSILSICWLISALHSNAIWVQFAWYQWYQSLSVAVVSQVVECSVLLEQLVECLRIQQSATKSSSRVYPHEIISFHNTLMTNHSITYSSLSCLCLISMFIFNLSKSCLFTSHISF
jgi:hypothetical protein